MKRLGYSAVIAGLAWAAACASDPTAVLRNGLKALSLDPDVMFIAEGDNRGFNVIPRDEQLNPIAAAVTVQSINPGVATVTEDPGQPSTDGSNHRYVVTAVAPGQVKLAVTSGSLSDTATINVLPVAFTGTPSATSLLVGDVLTILATPLLKFADTSNVGFGDSTVAELVSASPETLQVRVPQPNGASGKLTVTHVSVTYVPGLAVDLPTSATFTVANPFGSHSSPDPAATVTIPANGGQATAVYDGFTSGATDVDHYYAFTTAATDTITFQLDWNTGADLDMYVCDAGCNTFEGGGNKYDAATGANPEIVTMILPAGTHNLYINVYDTGDEPAHLYKITITNP